MINFDLLTRLYNQRQSGFPGAQLRQNGVRIYAANNNDTIKAIMSFAIPGWDDYGKDPVMGGVKLEGIQLLGASAPPASELTLIYQGGIRQLDMQVITLAYTSGACDLSRYQWPDRVEWFFKPSWRAAFRDFGVRLDDRTVNTDGLRSSTDHGHFPARLMSDFGGTDCYQHIYEFGSSKTIKDAVWIEKYK